MSPERREVKGAVFGWEDKRASRTSGVWKDGGVARTSRRTISKVCLRVSRGNEGFVD